MGINGLRNVIKTDAPKALEEVAVDNLRGSVIGIDTSIVVYRLACVGDSRNIKNRKGEPINHVQGMFYRTAKLLLAGIKPVYVYDGKPPVEKAATIMSRQAIRHAGKGSYATSQTFTDVIQLLSLMGVTQIQAKGEADSYLAHLSKQNKIDYVSSDDLDVLVFGSKNIITNLDANTVQANVIMRDSLIQELQITPKQFVDLCILLGCDYTGTIPRLGTKSILKTLRQYGSIEAMAASGKYDTTRCDYVGARRVFQDYTIEGTVIERAFQPEQLRKFLVERFQLDPKRIDPTLASLTNLLSKK